MAHPELARLRQEVTATEEAAAAVLDGLTVEAANWRPAGGRGWSAVQCIDHLARMNRYYVGAVLPRVRAAAATRAAEPWDVLSSTAAGRWFVSTLEPPPRYRSRVPAREVEPPDTIEPATALRDFIDSHRWYDELLALCEHVNPNRVRVPNPFLHFVPMRVATILRIIPAHNRRHLWQAGKAREQVPS